MRIAFITTGNIYMNSSANIRNIALIKGLEKTGNYVQVLCFENNKMKDLGFCADLEDSKVYCIGKKDVCVVYNSQEISRNNTVKGWKYKLKRKLISMYRHVQIYDPYKHKLNEINPKEFDWNDYDICISSSDPKSSHLLVYQAKKAGYKFKWVQYWGDPMTLDLTIKSWVSTMIQKEERKLFSMGDLIVFTNKASKDVMKNNYPEYASKFVSIPTSCYTSVSTMSKKNNLVVELGYYGGCSKINRNIIPLVNVIKRNNKLHLTLAGGNDYGLINENQITVYDRVDSLKIDELTSKTDILVVLENFPKNKNPNEPCKQIPGKMYHYALLKKPILVICETFSLKKEFEKYDVYYFCMNKETEIEASINCILNDFGKRKFESVHDFMPESVAQSLLNYL